MERPKQITYMAAWLCIIGALMMAWGSMHASERLEGYFTGTQSSYLRYEQQVFSSYGAGIYVSAMLVTLIGMWAIYAASRIVVARSEAVVIAKRWVMTQKIFVVCYLLSAAVAIGLDAALSSGEMDTSNIWFHTLVFISALPAATPMCGIGAYMVARYIERNLARADVQQWFAAAQYAGLEEVENHEEN